MYSMYWPKHAICILQLVTFINLDTCGRKVTGERDGIHNLVCLAMLTDIDPCGPKVTGGQFQLT